MQIHSNTSRTVETRSCGRMYAGMRSSPGCSPDFRVMTITRLGIWFVFDVETGESVLFISIASSQSTHWHHLKGWNEGKKRPDLMWWTPQPATRQIGLSRGITGPSHMAVWRIGWITSCCGHPHQSYSIPRRELCTTKDRYSLRTGREVRHPSRLMRDITVCAPSAAARQCDWIDSALNAEIGEAWEHFPKVHSLSTLSTTITTTITDIQTDASRYPLSMAHQQCLARSSTSWTIVFHQPVG